MGALNRLVYIFEGKDQLSPVGRKAAEKMSVYGKMAGTGFSSKMGAGLRTVGPMALSAIGVGLVYAVKQGLKVPMSQLKVSLADAGSSFDAMKPKINTATNDMAKLGFGMGDTYQAIINMTRATGNGNLAIRNLASAADLAKVKNISLADASMLLAKAADGSLKALKGMNIATATGSTQSTAMSAAQKILMERVKAAGGIEKFAAQNHMSAAAAIKLVAAASYEAQAAQNELAKHGLSVATATGLITEAANGNKDALKTLKEHNLSLSDATLLVNNSSKGSIDAFNKLGITVLPKTATAADRLSQIQKVLNQRIGGTAAAASKTFAGKLKVLKTQFSNIAAQVGLFILPYLSQFASLLQKVAGNKVALAAFAAVIGTIALGFLAIKIAALAAFVAENLATFGIVAGVVAVVAGLVWVVKNWDKVKAAIGKAWKWLHDHPFIAMIVPFIGILLVLGTHWKTLRDIVIAVWHKIYDTGKSTFGKVTGIVKGVRNFAIDAFRKMWSIISSVFGNILHGAAVAFGWIPGIGGKLKKADKAFQAFRKNVNAELDRLQGKKIHVGVKWTAQDMRAAGFAAGGPFRGKGTSTSDSNLAYLSDDEYIMQAKAHRKYGTFAMDAVNRGDAHIVGYAKGGAAKGVQIQADVPDAVRIAKNLLIGITQFTKANIDKIFGAQGSAIVAFARSFVGKVPYVWGGTSPVTGWDCSGFTQYVLGHFGIHAPRVSQDQQRWAKHSGNVPGALVFFGNPAHHVGFATGTNRYISARGVSYGTTISNVGGNSGFGLPPGGIGGMAANYAVNLGRMMAAERGWTGAQWQALYQLWQHESGWNPNARNPFSGAAGIPQDITGNFHGGAAGQIRWGMNYIQGRYHSPLRAWNAWLSRSPHWYSKGGPAAQSFDSGHGVLRPGYTLAYNGRGRNEYLSENGGVTVIVKASAILGTKREVARYVSDALQEFKDHGGRLPK
jgi:cell wall-associated NlpC family hydrolase